MKTYFLDTESCGLYGVPVLLQYAIDDGNIVLVDLWKESIGDMMMLIEDIVANRTVAHNINFDWQMIQKFYNMLAWALNHTMVNTMEELSVGDMIEAEWQSQFGMCLKPAAAVDTMIQASKGNRQSALMAAKPIYIRRVPKKHAQALADELTDRTDLPWILFARNKVTQHAKWILSERIDDEGNEDPHFIDVCLKFNPSNGLKDLHKFLFDFEVTAFDDIMPEEFPTGEGFCPYVKPLMEFVEGDQYINLKGDKAGRLWPSLIRDHIEFWATNEDAREYGKNDIVMLRDLYEHFGVPENDTDAKLACQIASVRLYGFNLDLDAMVAARVDSQKVVDEAPINVNSPKQVKEYISEAFDEMERLIVAKGCDAETLEKIVKEFTLDEEEDCECEDQRFCVRCGGTGVVGPGPMEVAKRATLIEDVRRHKKRVELFDKLLRAGRAYPNFRAVGTKSGRLSGTDGLNFQGVDSSELVRGMFILADDGEVLSGGDYDGQEVAIAGTTMNDTALLDDMRKGKKIHGLFAAELFETTYDVIMEHSKTDIMTPTRYARGKSAVFLTIYGGTAHTMSERAGVSVEAAEKAFNAFVAKYPGVGHTKKMIDDRFSAISRTDEGKMLYKEPSEKFIESIFGFRRYFNTEYKLGEMIFDMVDELFNHDSQNPFINMIQTDEEKIMRDTRNMREQSMAGCLSSALIGSVYSVINGIIRAANNHLIQSAGRTITVGLQQAIWELQPDGIHPFVVRPMSVHDEVACVSGKEMVEPVTDVVRKTLDKQCDIVPLLQMDWGRYLESWGAMKAVDASKPEFDAVHVGIVL